jgi:S-DNA-T family DNA segregation ATPase FtsK/SpoIIIE
MATRFLSAGTFLPPSVMRFVRRRLAEALGVFLALFALGLALALATYNAQDPSLNTASASEPTNLLGAPGAIVSDLLVQTMGLASWLLGPLALAWAWRLTSHAGLTRVWLRIGAAPMALIAAAIALAAADRGGIVGALPHANLADSLGSWTNLTVLVVTGPAACVAIAMMVVAMGLSRAEWHIIGRAAWRGCRYAGAVVRPLLSRSPRPSVAKTEKPAKISSTREEAAKREPSIDLPGARRSTPIVETPQAKPRAGKKAASSRQTALEFEGEFSMPPLDLLDPPPEGSADADLDDAALEHNARILETVLDDFGVKGDIVRVRPGPVVTLYELEPAPGTKSSRVIGLADDIARSMSAISVRIAVIPGRNVIGIELPNANRELVSLRELLSSAAFERSSSGLTLMLGKDIGGTPVLADLARMPHLLIAGTTGSGKSVGINTMILSMLYRLTPDQCRFIMIDPKMLELSVYDGIPHLLAPVVTEPSKAVVALRWAVGEMENRYRLMSTLGVRSIDGYNARLAEAKKSGETLSRTVQTGFDPSTGSPIFEEQPLDTKPLPLIVVVVDEMADLMLVAGKDVEGAVQRLSQMARAAGIHLIMATQRPSVDVITGTIKSNFPTRISFQVTSKIDSRTILGEAGAEQLLGQGDMLHMAGGGRVRRIHGPFVSDVEVERVVAHLLSQGEPDYVEAVTDDSDNEGFGFDGVGGDSGDELYDRAVALVCRERKASTSFVQRHLQIGYNRAARLIERMEVEGVISQANHVGRREVLGRNIEDPMS